MWNYLGENTWPVAINYFILSSLRVQAHPSDCRRVAGVLHGPLLLVMLPIQLGNAIILEKAHKAHSLECFLFYQYIGACLNVYYSTWANTAHHFTLKALSFALSLSLSLSLSRSLSLALSLSLFLSLSFSNHMLLLLNICLFWQAWGMPSLQRFFLKRY